MINQQNSENEMTFDINKAIRPSNTIPTKSSTKLPKMRTIDEAYDILKGLDQGTRITKYFIRELCKASKVHCIKTGNKYLLDIDDLCNKLKQNIAI